MNIKKQRMTKDLDILMATQRARFTDNPFRDDGPLATLEKAISFIATLEAERDAALAETERLRSALAGVMPMVEKYVSCNHDWSDCENVRNRDAARAALKGTV